ncbi:MAG: hypothetical protein ACYTG0_12710 [Planctomycetota bacterium]|jgi:hypothetical protein
MSKLDYEALHGGKKAPRGRVDFKQWYGPVEVVGEIESISYRADKGQGMSTYQHRFDPHDGRGPYLLRGVEGDGKGDARVENPVDTKTEIGHAVDIVLADGRRIILSDAILATDESGDQVVIESESGIPYQIEQRVDGHYVTTRGIEE